MRLVPLLMAVAASALLSPCVFAQTTTATPTDGPPPAPTAIVTVATPVAPATIEAPAQPAPTMTLPRRAVPTLIVRIDLSTQRMQLRYDGRAQETWAISSGREGFPTPRGVFRPQWAAKMWHSRKYDMAPMPHAVFFSGGVAVHATEATRLLGQPASHGCIRLAPQNAARFYALVHKHGYAATRIEVIGTPPAPRIASRPAPPRRDRVLAATRPSAFPPKPATRSVALAPMPRNPVVRQFPNGLVHLPPGSPLHGRSSFVMNGVTYVRVR